MSVIIKPAGLAGMALTANTLSLTASYLEKYKKPCCCNASVPVQTSVSYSTGQVTLNETSVFVPVIATITAVYVMNNGTTKVNTFAEVFSVAFQGQDAAPTGVTITSVGRNAQTATNCKGVTSLSIDDSITIAIA